jgi:hypothetical protein
MSYRQPSFAGVHSSEYGKMGGSHFSRPGFTPARSTIFINLDFKDDSVGGSFG